MTVCKNSFASDKSWGYWLFFGMNELYLVVLILAKLSLVELSFVNLSFAKLSLAMMSFVMLSFAELSLAELSFAVLMCSFYGNKLKFQVSKKSDIF